MLPPHCFKFAVLSAAEDIAAQQPAEPIDTIALANNIAYYADGRDVYYGFFWKWADGQGDSIERACSAAETGNGKSLEEETFPEGGGMTADESTERSEPCSPPRTVSAVARTFSRSGIPLEHRAHSTVLCRSPTQGLLGRFLKPASLADELEPISIFGLSCISPVMCTRRHH